MKQLAAVVSTLVLFLVCAVAQAQQLGNNSGPKPDGIALDGLKEFGRDLERMSTQWQGTIKAAADQIPKAGVDSASNLSPYLVAIAISLVLVALAIAGLGVVQLVGLFMDRKQS